MRKPFKPLYALFIAGLTTLSAAPTFAATNPIDLEVGMKTLALLQDKIQGVVKVAIVFDPTKQESKTDAQSIKAFFDRSSTQPGEKKFSASMVPVSDIKDISNNSIVILAGGLDNDYNNISSVAASKGLLTMSSDLNCVRTDKCVLGIVSEPNVEIYYSQNAAKAAKIVFAQAFTMLVKLI